MSSGHVTIAGSGPGDPGLMTLALVDALAEADVVLYDSLVPAAALSYARSDAELIDVGKIGGGPQVPQEVTNNLLIEHAQAGRTVLRLKGGDPFVFGRGGEEALLLREHGIPFSVIPGVTAAVGAAAHAGIPVTQRGMAAGVAFVTGHEDPAKGESSLDWTALASFPGTLAFYMGVRTLPTITARLIAAGRRPDEPAAIIERGTLGDQRTLNGTLETIAEVAEAGRAAAPAVVIVGDVAALSQELAWRGRGPLAGVSVVVTRPAARAPQMSKLLLDQGARVVEAPVTTTSAVDFSLPTDMRAFDLAAFSSPESVDSLFGALRAAGQDARALANAKVAVTGPGTADAVRRHGIEPDLIPPRAVGESLAELLATMEVQRALVVRAVGGRAVVADALAARGADVTVIEPYTTSPLQLDDRTARRVLGADWATVTSASSARALCDAIGGPDAIHASGLRIASIGPITTDAIKALGLEPDLEGAHHTPAGLVAALVDHLSR